MGKLLTVKFSIIKMEFIRQEKLNNLHAGIPRFTLLMWGHIKKCGKRKPRKSRLLSSTKGEENRIEL